MALYTQHMQIGFPLLGTASYMEIAVLEDNSVCNATFYLVCAICDLHSQQLAHQGSLPLTWPQMLTQVAHSLLEEWRIMTL